MVAAAIVCYNPDIYRLRDNISSIINQVDEVFIFDNASSNYDQIYSEFSSHVKFIHNTANIGIASALNRISEYAYQKGYQWLLTLDQDSICSDSIISEYKKHLSYPSAGIFCPNIQQLSVRSESVSFAEKLICVDHCITSGSLVNLNVWKEIGGYWDELFIDMVDFDFCWSVKESGYKICYVNSAVLFHQVGSGQTVRFRNHDEVVFHHTPVRYYYIARNSIVVGTKHHRLYQCLCWLLKRIYLVCKYENNKIQKLRYITQGIVHGCCSKLGPYKP